jgi:hypothetical protein
MERWKPEYGERYFCVDFGYFGIVCDHCWGILPICDSKFYEVGNVFKTKAEAQAAAEKVKALMLGLHGEQTVTDCNQSAQPTTNSSQLPKLTNDVFYRSDCPLWAVYAAVDKYGSAFFFEIKPSLNTATEKPCIWFSGKAGRIKQIPGKWDASDWQHSLIEIKPLTFCIRKSTLHTLESAANELQAKIKERPAKKSELPDWCKVGEWVFDKAINKYSQVAPEDITEHLQEVCKIIFKGEIVQARLRPYNAKEMMGLVGKVICGNDTDFRAMIVYADGGTNRVETIHYDYDAEELARCYNIDGKPCGVLEHLENGEWVE